MTIEEMSARALELVGAGRDKARAAVSKLDPELRNVNIQQMHEL